MLSGVSVMKPHLGANEADVGRARCAPDVGEKLLDCYRHAVSTFVTDMRFQLLLFTHVMVHESYARERPLHFELLRSRARGWLRDVVPVLGGGEGGGRGGAASGSNDGAGGEGGVMI